MTATLMLNSCANTLCLEKSSTCTPSYIDSICQFSMDFQKLLT